MTITYRQLSVATHECVRQLEKLGQVNPHHPLSQIPVFTKTGERIIIQRFWPSEGEVTSELMEDMLRVWVNFYTALIFARMSEVAKKGR